MARVSGLQTFVGFSVAKMTTPPSGSSDVCQAGAERSLPAVRLDDGGGNPSARTRTRYGPRRGSQASPVAGRRSRRGAKSGARSRRRRTSADSDRRCSGRRQFHDVDAVLRDFRFVVGLERPTDRPGIVPDFDVREVGAAVPSRSSWRSKDRIAGLENCFHSKRCHPPPGVYSPSILTPSSPACFAMEFHIVRAYCSQSPS